MSVYLPPCSFMCCVLLHGPICCHSDPHSVPVHAWWAVHSPGVHSHHCEPLFLLKQKPLVWQALITSLIRRRSNEIGHSGGDRRGNPNPHTSLFGAMILVTSVCDSVFLSINIYCCLPKIKLLQISLKNYPTCLLLFCVATPSWLWIFQILNKRIQT